MQQSRWYHVEIRAEGNRISVLIDGELVIDYSDTTPILAGQIGLYSNAGASTARTFDDILVTRLGNSGCYVGASDLVTYTLTISNQARLPGYDLVITDSLPSGMSLVTYTMQSNDPASSIAAEPSPIPGATGVLTWGVSQLRAISPFTSLVHQALTLTVVLQVSPAIMANTVLSNQAAFAYDNWLGSTSPTTITRQYSGGSHSTAVRTLNSGLTKTVTFSPPPTATLGSLVTYTLIIPSPIISATMYNVGITDTINPSMTVEAVTTAGGVGASSGWSGRTVTATFASVPSYTQAYVTVTARISSALGAYAGYAITNSAVMTHATGGLTSTLPVTTIVGEPSLALVKSSNPPTSNTVSVGQRVTYTVYFTNASGVTRSAAYDIAFTDTLPVGLRVAPPTLLTITVNGTPVSLGDYSTSYDPAAGAFTVTFAPGFAIPVGGVLAIQYVATVDSSVQAVSELINLAQVTWSSLGGAPPGDRNYGPVSGTTDLHARVSLGNYVWYDLNNNGSVDASEVGVPGVVVELYRDANGDGVFTLGVDQYLSTTTTNVGGYYTFANLLPSLLPTQTYVVVITSTNFTGAGAFRNYQNSDGSVGGNSDLNDRDHGEVNGTLGAGGYVASTAVSVTVGTEPVLPNDDDTDNNSNTTIDFGFYRLSLGDYVWYDDNNNGVWDTGEAGASGVTVRLLDATGASVLGTTTTDANGYYTFTNLLSSTYRVEIVVLATYTSSTDIASSVNPDNNVNSDDNGVMWATANVVRSNPVTLVPGYVGALGNNTVDNATGSTHNPTVDFGLVHEVSLGDQVWYDVNDNGVLDGGEVGVPGVAVELYQDTNGDGVFTPGVDQYLSSTVTIAGGWYSFTHLLPSRFPTEAYLVVVTTTNFVGGGALVGYQDSDGSVDGNSDLNSNDHGVVNGGALGSGGWVASTAVSLTVGGEPVTDGDADANSNLTIDFGFYLGRIGDYVWAEVTADGIQGTSGETPIPGGVIDLYNSTTGAYLTSTTTNGSGYYLFDNLLLNVTYTVQLSQVNFLPGGALYQYTPTLYLGGTPFDNTDSNANAGAVFNGFGYAVTTTLTMVITQDFTLDFGFTIGLIGDYV